MDGADFLVIGGGIAGLSAAERLARHGRVIVVEAEAAVGYHSSGRSVSFSHYGIGDRVVRALTRWSRAFFEDPPEGFCPTPLGRIMPTLYFADRASLPALDALGTAIAGMTDAVSEVDADHIRRLCPALTRADHGLLDPTGIKIDTDALLQAHARAIRAAGSEVRIGWRVAAIGNRGGTWRLTAESGETVAAPVLIDAAGAWADRIAALAGVAPLGLLPKRRTIIVVEPPPDADIAAWPFVHAVAGDFYMLPEAGRLLVSPVDEVGDDPCDAQPGDYDIAFAADRLEHYTSLKVARIAHRWAGLRTFARDRVPVAGFAPDAPGFFWLAGQGGYGFQTAPAMAAATEALVTGGAWPKGLAELGVAVEHLAPARLA